jgi:hypothetical protein
MYITMRDVNTAFQRCAGGRHPSYVVRCIGRRMTFVSSVWAHRKNGHEAVTTAFRING